MEFEPLRGQGTDRSGVAAGPSLEGGGSHGFVEVEEKLIGETADGGWLAEGEAEADGALHVDAAGFDGFVFEELDEAAAAGVRPEVAAEQVAQFLAELEGGFALANPFEDVVAPAPMQEQAFVLFDEVDGQVEAALLQEDWFFGEGGWGNHVFGFHDPFRHADDLVGAVQLNVAVDEQRREFVHPVAWDFYEFAIANDLHRAPWIELNSLPTYYHRLRTEKT